MTTIGVTSVGSGVGQSVLRALAFGELAPRTVGFDVAASNSGIHWADVALLVPPVRDAAAHREALLTAVRDQRIEVLIPGNDLELAPIAALRDELATLGCTPIVSAPSATLLSGDKLAMARWSAERELPFVRTWSLPEARDAADELTYPLIAKPRTGSASDGIALLRDAGELRALPGGTEVIVQPFLPPVSRDLRRDDRGGLRQTHEVSAQYVLAASGRILGSFVSMNRLKGGVPVEVVPVDEEPWADDGRALAEALALEGAVGPVNLQGRVTEDGRVVFFEANLRFTGITGVRAMMGFREVEASILALVADDEDAAERVLRHDGGLVGFRHIGDSVVGAARVSELARDGQLGRAAPTTPVRSVAVTGAASYLGRSAITALLAAPGVERIHALVREGSPVPHEWPADRVTVATFDLLGDELELPRVDVVLHLAAMRAPADGPAPTPDLFATNVEGTARLAHAARAAGIRRIVYASSQSVYGSGRPPLWHESLPPRPESGYAMSKFLGESALRVVDGLEVVVLRLGRLYGLGPGMRWGELPHKFSELAVAGGELVLDGSGLQRMDLLHVRDAARALLAAADAPVGLGTHVVNVGGGSPLSVLGLAELVIDAASDAERPAPRIVHRGDPTTTSGTDYGMHIRRARSLLDWSPTVSPQAGVAELVAEARRLD